VTIQPLEVRHPGLDSATRRSLFQRRRVSSPISPKQMEALAKSDAAAEEMASSPTLRRCCGEYPSSDGASMVLLDHHHPHVRERKLSRGDASDSSSKDSSIQSDTSLDSEDSCVSVIFIPHPDAAMAPAVGPPPSVTVGRSQRSTSNSSESSDSTGGAAPAGSANPQSGSGRGSPVSPGGRNNGSPAKSAFNTGQETNVSSTATTTTATIYVVERPLEKIDERHTESETDDDDKLTRTNVMKLRVQEEKEETPCLEEEICPQEHPDEDTVPPSRAPEPEPIPAPTPPSAPRRQSGAKSFEMEDLPDDNPIRCHPPSRARRPRPSPLTSAPRGSNRRSQSRRFDYPIVRHHPLFAKQKVSPAGADGRSSNFSSLLMGENVRVIRRSSAVAAISASMPERDSPSAIPTGPGKMRSFEIFNPETDDLSSDSNDDDDSSGTDSGSDCSSVESVVSVHKDDPVQEMQQPPTVVVTEPDIEPSPEDEFIPKMAEVLEREAPATMPTKTDEDVKRELSRRSDERKRILQLLLEENQSLLGGITRASSRRSRAPVGAASSVDSADERQPSFDASSEKGGNAKQTLPSLSESPTPAPPSSSSAALAVPISRPTKKRLDKARSVSPSATVRHAMTIHRQSSAPSAFGEPRLIRPSSAGATTESPSSSNGSSAGKKLTLESQCKRTVILDPLDCIPSFL